MKYTIDEYPEPQLKGLSYNVKVTEDDEETVIGRVRFDVFAAGCLVHPQVYEFTPRNAKVIRDAMWEAAPLIAEEWDFEYIHAVTDNEKFANFFAKGLQEVVDVLPEPHKGTVYKYKVR